MWFVRYKCGCSADAPLKRELLEYCGKHGGDAIEWLNTKRVKSRPEPDGPLPTDHELRSLLHEMWRRGGLNLEHSNIAACMASNMRVKATEQFKKFVHDRLKAMVKSGDIRRQRFLPGRPFYTPG